MKTISFTNFRKNASEMLSLVEKGETIQVLRHGRVVAKVVPAEAQPEVPSWKKPSQPLVKQAVSLSDAILDERRSGR